MITHRGPSRVPYETKLLPLHRGPFNLLDVSIEKKQTFYNAEAVSYIHAKLLAMMMMQMMSGWI